MTTVVVADDQELVRSGLRMLLEARGIDVVGDAADGEQAVAVVMETQPDVVLMDLRMPVMDGIAATAEIARRQARTRVLVLTTFDLDEYVFRALRAGASGFLLKSVSPDRLIAGIETVAAGEALLSPGLRQRLVDGFMHPSPSDSSLRARLESLTPRELEVLRRIGMGMSNDQIAHEFVLTTATVKSHVNHLFSKLGITSRAQAVVFAYEQGLVRALSQA